MRLVVHNAYYSALKNRCKMKPREFINFVQENSNNNGTLKSSFVMHYLGKFSDQELDGLKS
jgi:hypothetical protein